MSLRLNLRISNQEKDFLNKKSFSAGLPKSKLVKQWLQETSESLILYPVQDNLYTTTHIRLDTKTADFLEERSHVYGVSKNVFIRTIIRQNMLKKEGQLNPLSDVSTEFFKQSNYKKLADYFENYNGRLNDHQKILLATSQMNFAKYYDALSTLSTVDRTLGNIINPFYIDALAMKARIYMYLKNLFQVKVSLEEATSLAKTLNSEQKIGLVLKQRSLYYYYLGNLSKAKKFAKKAAIKFKNCDQKENVAACYIFLTNYATKEFNFELARKYLNEAILYLNSSSNLKYLGLYHLLRAYIGSVNDPHSIDKSLRESSKYFEISGMNPIMNNVMELTAMNFYVKGETQKAYILFNELVNNEIKYKKNIIYSKPKLFKLFIESKHNYKKCINSMMTMMEKSSQKIRPDVSEYLINTTMFLNSHDSNEKNDAKINLKKQAIEAKSLMIRKAAEDTLTTKQISFCC